jgi:tetratricopeptide (TPR) repeat protein
MMGFGRRRKARKAVEDAAAVTTLLGLSGADLSAARGLVEAAEERLGQRAYREAEGLAARARALAEDLEEAYGAYRSAADELRHVVEAMAQIAADTSDAEYALVRSGKLAAENVEGDGVWMPNYGAAAEVARDGLDAARDRLGRYREASNAVFTAQLALEALEELASAVPLAALEARVQAETETLYEGAVRNLMAADTDSAVHLAREVEERANRTRMAAEDARRRLERTEALLDRLRGKGIAVVDLDLQVGEAKALLETGRFLEADRRLARTHREGRKLGEGFGNAQQSLREAEDAVAKLLASGLTSFEASHLLEEARRAFLSGAYPVAIGRARECLGACRRRMEVQKEIAQGIERLHRRVRSLRRRGASLADDVEEMLLKAEREFAMGDYRTSREDLDIAWALLGSRADEEGTTS